MTVIFFQCTINTICNISLPTITTTIYPKAAPYPPQFGWHFSDSSADCGKLTFGKLNSPSSCSSELAPPPTGNHTSLVHHSPLWLRYQDPAINLSYYDTLHAQAVEEASSSTKESTSTVSPSSITITYIRRISHHVDSSGSSGKRRR